MTRRPYNGWANYQTWAVQHWLANQEGCHRYWQERAQEWAKAESARFNLAGDLRNHHNGIHDDAGVCLLGATLSKVNWREIAAALLQELADD